MYKKVKVTFDNGDSFEGLFYGFFQHVGDKYIDNYGQQFESSDAFAIVSKNNNGTIYRVLCENMQFII